MHVAQTASLHAAPPASAARVVFLRESSRADSRGIDEPRGMAAYPTPVHVIDERGGLLGDLAPGTWFATVLPAGEHLLVAYHDGTVGDHETSVLRATLAPGRSYYVALTRTHGSLLTYGGLHLVRAPLPLAPRADLVAFVTDAAAAGHWSGVESDSIHARLDEARALFAAGKFEVLRQDDGFLLEGKDP
jgi:hypothetical protein